MALPCRVLRSLLVCVAVAILATPAVAGPQEKLDKVLREAIKSGSPHQRVIIRTKPGHRLAISKSLKSSGRHVEGDHASIDAITAELSADDIAALAESSSALSVSIDANVRADQILESNTLTETNTLTGSNTLLAPELVTAPTVRAVLGPSAGSATGNDIGVAIIDSGFTTNSFEFGGRITAFYDFTHGAGPVAGTPYDDYGHGTHVAALIGGTGDASYGKYPGVAPQVRLIGLKVLDSTGAGLTSHVIQAIELAIANRQQLGIDILNLSLGHPIYEPASTDPLVQAVEAAARAGIVVVVSAGNYGKSVETGLPGYAGITSPGNAPSAITVGATNTFETLSRRDDTVPTFSSRGPSWFDGFAKPDVVAPGYKLTSIVPGNSSLFRTVPAEPVKAKAATHYIKLSGSSMAAAVTTGVVATILEANRTAYTAIDDGRPSLTPNSVKAILQYTATPIGADGAPYDVLTQGTGEVNGAGATELALAINTLAELYQPWLVQGVTSSTSFGIETLSWAKNIVWGDNVVWGDSLMLYNLPMWASDVVWGDNVVWGDIVWGENIVWGDSFEGANAGKNGKNPR